MTYQPAQSADRILPPYDLADPELSGHYGSDRGAVVALSGGQDSATCLHYALRRYEHVLTVSFDYGQRHRVELVCAEALADAADVPWRLIDVPAFGQMGDAALTRHDMPLEAVATQHHSVMRTNNVAVDRGLPSTFVPGRNLILLGLAAAYGLARGADVLVTGVCQQDRSGYPDCRREFIEAFVDAFRLGTDTVGFAVDAPLLDRDKAETWQLADDLGIVDLVINSTHTCYEGDHETRHEWGYGCGQCGACDERRRGYGLWVTREAVRPR